MLGIGAASPAPAQSWSEEKCARYARAWAEASAHFGTDRLGREFLVRHQAFLASGCRARTACPRSAEEIEMADIMTMLALNARISATFLPFRC